MISYAQNLEDVILFRVLKDVTQGVYIDIGAQHPIADSVTKAFYEAGWRGINIEPVQEFFDLLRQDRPGDINLQCLVSHQNGQADFYVVADTGLSTMDAKLAQAAHRPGSTRKISRPTFTLDEIHRLHPLPKVHFLKVDVEGAERAVLEGWTNLDLRPWVVLIEAADPVTHQDVSAEWEPVILAKGYVRAYFDGLNVFYVAKEKQESLLPSFRCPPNVFDEYVLHSTMVYQAAIDQCQIDLQQLQSTAAAVAPNDEAAASAARRNALCSYVASLEQELMSVYSSRSWSLTSPVRFVGDLWRSFLSKAPQQRQLARDRAGRTLVRWYRRISWIPGVKLATRCVLSSFPALKSKLMNVPVSVVPPDSVLKQPPTGDTRP